MCAPDLLGHGFTGSGDYLNGLPYPYTVAHLQKMADSLGLEKFTVIGSSFGALISALLYFAMPERVEKLVLISSGSSFNPEEGFSRTLQESFQNGISAFANPSVEACRKRMARIFYEPDLVPEELLMIQMTSYALPGVQESYERRMQGMMDIERSRPYRILDRLEQIKVPTLAIFGGQDPRISNPQQVEESVKRIPNGKIVTFDRCGHLPHMEHPEKFNELIRGFVHGEAA